MWFTGEGVTRDWVCAACAQAHPTAPSLRQIDDAWWTAHGDDIGCQGAVGSPEVRERATGLEFEHEDVALSLHAELVDMHACAGSAPAVWVLVADGALLRIDLATAAVTLALALADLGFDVNAGCGLCLSPVDDYCAVYEASGSRGAVVDLRDGRVVRRLHRGAYRPQNSLFPVAFARRDGRTLLVVGSDWNRLDLVDVAAERVLSERAFAPSEGDASRPSRCLDYFHGSLSVSPDGAWIVDSGWVWAPAGIVRAWSLDRWRDNPWESEDGPSLRRLATRDYYWDGPVCWVDEATVALWGWGHDDEWLVPAALLFDAREGRLLRWFPGPRVRPPKAWPPRELADSMVFDGYLFTIHDAAGTAVWDVASGERLHVDPTLKPSRYHRGAKEFLTRTADGLRRSRLRDRR